ncbi:MAG: hypothetical protein IIA45_01580 [Bacteroidetes bacterium]|nr:hypothetical protein [Bacteroidota bacterium]
MHLRSKVILETKPRLSSGQKLLVIFSIFGVFSLMLISLFVFKLVDIPKKATEGPNIVSNSSFEVWAKGVPVGWKKDDSFIFDEPSELSGRHAVGIYAREENESGIYQTIKLDEKEVYNVYFSLKANTFDVEDAGVRIEYEGENVRTTVDMAPGVHYYDGKNSWRQYFGKVTGAESVKLYFFSKNSTILYVDAIGIGINLSSNSVLEPEDL